jgi:hypothetical protein
MLIVLLALMSQTALAAEKEKPKPKHPDVVVMGGLEQTVIEEYVDRHMPQFRACFERQADADPQLKGRVDTRFVIDKTGHVSEAGVTKTTLNNKKAEDCVVGVIKHTVFPEPLGGGVVEVDYPFDFSLKPHKK